MTFQEFKALVNKPELTEAEQRQLQNIFLEKIADIVKMRDSLKADPEFCFSATYIEWVHNDKIAITFTLSGPVQNMRSDVPVMPDLESIRKTVNTISKS